MAYTNIDDPSAHYQSVTYTGNSGTLAVVNDGNSDLKPDLFIQKRTDQNGWHWVDSSRGVSKNLASQDNAGETTFSNNVTSFNTDGFTLGGGDTSTNASGASYYTQQFKANGGTTSSNSNGSITSTVQANTDAGFSIVTYTGTGSAATVGHGLNNAPSVIIFKNRSGSNVWAMYCKSEGENKKMIMGGGSNNQPDDDGAYMNGTLPTSSVFSVGASANTNTGSSNYVAYCFEEKQGFMKQGTYVGNANANGAFIYTGFAPRSVWMCKATGISANWLDWNVAVDITKGNPINKALNFSFANAGSSFDAYDFLSNGFKVRVSGSAVNGSATKYLYIAFAENPFVTSTGVPTTAR